MEILLSRGRAYITEENEKDCSLYSEKDPFKSVSCCRFQFHYSDKKVDRLRECSKKQSIYIGKLDALL